MSDSKTNFPGDSTDEIIALINEMGGSIVVKIPSRASRIASANLDAAVTPVLEKYRELIATLHPGESRDIYPWHTSECVVMEAACRLRNEGWRVVRHRYEGSRANYSGGNYFIRVTAPVGNERGIFCRTLAALGRLCDR